MARKRHLEGLPGMADPTKLDLSGAKILEPQGPTYTQHQTVFQHTQTNLAARVAEDGSVVGYQLTITDPQERHTYILPFDQSLKSAFQTTFNELPDVGQKIPEEAKDGPTLN